MRTAQRTLFSTKLDDDQRSYDYSQCRSRVMQLINQRTQIERNEGGRRRVPYESHGNSRLINQEINVTWLLLLNALQHSTAYV